jgi:hypothetical protein
MAQSFRGHWIVYGPPGFNGEAYGITFVDGFGYLSWRDVGEHQAEVAIQALGHDPRGFQVIEIAEKEYPPYGSK